MSTIVPRFFCETNYEIRKKTGEEKQYTITILPGFLIPHSTIPIDPVHQAADNYITRSQLNQVGAALRMYCSNPISFRLFLSRIRTRIEGWITLLLQLVLTLEGHIKEADVKRAEGTERQRLQAQWHWFVVLADEYVRLYARIPGTKVVPQKFLWQYIYCLLSRHRMDLGP